MYSNTVTLSEWLSFSSLGHGDDPCGLSSLHGGNLLYGPYFNIATRDAMFIVGGDILRLDYWLYGAYYPYTLSYIDIPGLNHNRAVAVIPHLEVATYTRDAIDVNVNIVSIRQYDGYYDLGYYLTLVAPVGGIYSSHAGYGTTHLNWYVATNSKMLFI